MYVYKCMCLCCESICERGKERWESESYELEKRVILAEKEVLASVSGTVEVS